MVLVLMWGRPVHAGDVVVVLGARRRWPFRCEGPNRSALLVEHIFGVVSERVAPEPPSAEDATAIEVAMTSCPAWPSRHHRDALSFAWCSAPKGLSRERGCYHCLGPPSSCALEGVFGATSVLESQTLELRGKRWLGQRRQVICRALLVRPGTPRTVGVLPRAG
ncbi:hypothetical protein Taro_040093 [Colocasia esculenta]|uniref:Uncharacterized protein n=1 Tax=Colocasia esculenta TaxID=4460 RepID=A0A843WTF4_COLES|nr:hypothetical protein [Colocasia esculenta]